MGKRRNVKMQLVDIGSIVKKIESHEQQTNNYMNTWMQKETRKGETGPGAAARKVKMPPKPDAPY